MEKLDRSPLYKYPRTPHIHWSVNRKRGDKWLKNTFDFYTKRIIATLKKDGECTTMYPDHIHARSLDSGVCTGKLKESRSYVKRLWGSIKHDIPENYRICGENVFAKHSIFYENLDDYFLVFSIWDGETCLSWDDTVMHCRRLGLTTVPVVTEFVWRESIARTIATDAVATNEEGIVFRNKDSFALDRFEENVCKYVRDNHVGTGSHWIYEPLVPNRLKKDADNK